MRRVIVLRIAVLVMVAAVAAVVTASLTGLGDDPTPTAGSSSGAAGSDEEAVVVPISGRAGEVVRARLEGEPVRLNLPERATPKGVVVWFHGQGAGVNDKSDGPLLAAIRRDGWAVASSDFHGESWGNEASTEDAANLVAWVKEQTGTTPVLWASGSMGGAVSLNAMLHGVEAPACWYGVKPAVSLTRMDDVPGAERFLDRAFDGAVPPERNPITQVDELPWATKYRVVASLEDQWVHYGQNAGRLVSGLRARGMDVSTFRATGTHEDPSHFNDADFVEFASSCLDTALAQQAR